MLFAEILCVGPVMNELFGTCARVLSVTELECKVRFGALSAPVAVKFAVKFLFA